MILGPCPQLEAHGFSAHGEVVDSCQYSRIVSVTCTYNLCLGESICNGESHLPVGLAISGVGPKGQLGFEHRLALQPGACGES